MPGPVPQLPPQELKALLAQAQPPLVLDVRNALETAAEGFIAGARLLPLYELPARFQELPRDQAIVCVCKSGMRSFNAAAFLRQQGYDASSLAGGMIAWLAAALPIARS